ncbi:uncharacterized protein LOC111064417 isoform X1 [Nilaparvata lugens]|uniref:uncharacterized protein LOC111064417 isoform X1 n=2 Tax=Nilaparvata lugens TaxID=108931 RepID=UPI00193D306A|nr:uncharacterized protein LOC111064417 isoform X1 [Nilaparvata lugens]
MVNESTTVMEEAKTSKARQKSAKSKTKLQSTSKEKREPKQKVRKERRDQEEEEDDGRQSPWVDLPDLLLERIYDHLTIKERFYTSQVCKSWNRGFYMPFSWSTFVFDEYTLTRRRFNYYSGWQYILDHLRTQQCLSTIGSAIRVLIFRPMTNFYNLYEFMNMISFYVERQAEDDSWTQSCGIAANIHTLHYTFPCSMQARDESERERLYGTGGKLLAALKRLMSNLSPSLRHLKLVDLMLDNSEALHLLDQFCCDCATSLRTLILINATKYVCPLLHVGCFLNLKTLIISPQNLSDDIVYLLSETGLQDLHIIQNRYTPLEVPAVGAKCWRECAKRSAHLSVHLRVESKRERQLLWQEAAPVRTVLFSSPQCKLTTELILKCVDLYGAKLEVFGHLGIPRFHQPESFNERNDPFLLLLCKMCPNLQTLAIRERISTATILLLAEFSKNLRNFYVRRNAVILRADWPKNPEWSDEFYYWLRKTSRSYELTEKEVSHKLGYKWTMLDDKEYKRVKPIVDTNNFL